MRVLIAGAGAIGQWLGAKLQAADHEVTLLARSRFHQALQAGLEIRGETKLNQPMSCIDQISQAAPGIDAIVITCKAYDTASMAQSVAPLIAEDGVIASLQNGLGNAQKLLHHVSPDQAAAALTSNGLTVEAPGRLYHAGKGPTIVGPAARGHPHGARQLLQLLHDAGLEPEWRDDMRPATWSKAIVNGAINPVGALHRVRNGDILAQSHLRKTAEDLVLEGTHIATAAGLKLDPNELRNAMLTTLERTGGNMCSMLQDVAARRPTEIDQITGRILHVAKRLDVNAPAMHHVYSEIKDLEAQYLGRAAVQRLMENEAEHLRDKY